MCAIETLKRMHLQVADVRTCLLSATKCAEPGYSCVLKKRADTSKMRVRGKIFPSRAKETFALARFWSEGPTPTDILARVLPGKDRSSRPKSYKTNQCY